LSDIKLHATEARRIAQEMQVTPKSFHVSYNLPKRWIRGYWSKIVAIPQAKHTENKTRESWNEMLPIIAIEANLLERMRYNLPRQL